MATPKTTLWERDPHTGAKHEMLGRYLEAWFRIIASSFRKDGLTYVDAFAGPGEYTGGEEGSPLIALAVARRRDVLEYRSPVRLLFIENSLSRVEHLNGLIGARCEPPPGSAQWELQTVHGRCEDVLIPALAAIGADKAPIFVNFDGWGVDTPMRLVRHVGRYPSAEVLVTFHTQWFLRFTSQQEVEAGDRVFGGKSWRRVAATGSPADKRRGLIDLYCKELIEARFSYSLVFEMVDESGHGFLLVYGTSNDTGLEKMKDAMWAVDPQYGQSFRDPRDVDQLVFPMSDKLDLSLLRRQLLERLEEGETTLEALKDFALFETMFKKTHVQTAINELEHDGKVECGRARPHRDFTVRLAAPRLFGES